jgi:hypothetical protein
MKIGLSPPEASQSLGASRKTATSYPRRSMVASDLVSEIVLTGGALVIAFTLLYVFWQTLLI